MKIRLRRARPEDAAPLTALSIRSKRSNGYDDGFMDACRKEMTITPEQISNRNYEFWVAEADSKCGCACLLTNPASHTGEVHCFYIEPDWHGQGVGRLLWSRLLDSARAKGLKDICLDADPNSVGFYEALGFVTFGDAPSGSIKGRRLPQMKISV